MGVFASRLSFTNGYQIIPSALYAEREEGESALPSWMRKNSENFLCAELRTRSRDGPFLTAATGIEGVWGSGLSGLTWTW